jgi:hypothetical protein
MVGTTVIGFTVIAIGAVMLVLPGPGLVVIEQRNAAVGTLAISIRLFPVSAM